MAAFVDYDYYDSTSDFPAINGLNAGSNAGRLLAVATFIGSAASIVDIDFNGVDISPAVASGTGLSSMKVAAYTHAPSGTGAQNLTSEMQPVGVGKRIFAATYDGIASVRSVTFVSSGGSASQPSASGITAQPGDIMVFLGEDQGIYDPTITPDSGCTIIPGSGFFIGIQKVVTAGGANSIGGTFSGAIHNWQGYVFVLVPTAPPGPTITGPSGAAGASSSTANVAENATTGPTFTTNTTLGSGYPTLTGTDASLWTLTTLSSTSWRVDPNPAKNFESPTDSGSNNIHDVVFNASASVSQSCAITITNVNEAPSFSGTLSVPTLTEGVAMTPVNAASLFSDPDSGDTGTYSAVGSWPAGVTVSSGGSISGTPTTPGTYANLRVRRTDVGSLTADSNLFTITVNAAASGPTIGTHPSNQTAQIGASAVFTVAATTSGGALSYQWRMNGNPISGATSSTYTRSGVALGDHGAVFTCAVTDSNGTVISNGATLTVAVTFVSGPVPDVSGTTGASGSIDLSSYFAGGLSRTYAVLSGTMPTGLSQVGTTAVWSGTLGAAGSGSFVVRATDSATNQAQTNTVDWVIGATAPGTITSEPLANNNNVPLPNVDLSWIAFRNRDTGVHALLVTGESTDSSAQFSVSSVSLTPGERYAIQWRTAAGEQGQAEAQAQ